MKAAHIKVMLASMVGLLLVGGTLVVSNEASADSIQVQSYQRSSQSAACTAQPGETQWLASWGDDPSWYPTWEQWANGGNGGWTCTRSITWAHDAASESVAYNVGDVGPAGGTIFYIDPSRPVGSQFWEVGSDQGTAPWGCNGTNIPEAEGAAIGQGKTNTDAILAGCATAGIAARLASAPAGGYSDWFMPSLDELNQVCKYARDQSTAVVDQAVPCDGTGSTGSGFPSIYFWSSTQYTGRNDIAWLCSLGGGYETNDVKDTLTTGVLPVRSF